MLAYCYPFSGVFMATNPGKRTGSNKWTNIFWLGVIVASGLYWVLAPNAPNGSDYDINTPALIGHLVRFARDAVGCPQLGSIGHLDNAIAAHDRVGFNRRMLFYGCIYIMQGNRGRVIDSSGILTQYAHVRLSTSGLAYWIEVGDVPLFSEAKLRAAP